LTRTLAVLAAVALGGGLAACFDDTKLLGAACLSDADCWRTQSCVQTPTELARGVEGQCRKDGQCEAGVQLGCRCALNSDGGTFCESNRFASSSDPATCICCPETDTVETIDSERVCVAVEPETETGPETETETET
jgi:hypothetical protein